MLKRWTRAVIGMLSMLLTIGLCVDWVDSFFVTKAAFCWPVQGVQTVWWQHQIIDDGGRVLLWLAHRPGDDAPRKVVCSRGERWEPIMLESQGIRRPSWHNGFGFHFSILGFPTNEMRKAASMIPPELASPEVMAALNPRPFNAYRVAVPHWFLILVAGTAAFAALRNPVGARRRLRRGLCPACSYDLRATPERCPECGRETTPAERERIRKLHGSADGAGAGAPGSGPLATAAGAGGGETDPHPGPLPADRESGRTT
jgi:hypothetical protein